jgi:hypothetical protein
VLPSSGDSFPHLIQKRRSQLGFVTYLLNYLRRLKIHSLCYEIEKIITTVSLLPKINVTKTCVTRQGRRTEFFKQLIAANFVIKILALYVAPLFVTAIGEFWQLRALRNIPDRYFFDNGKFGLGFCTVGQLALLSNLWGIWYRNLSEEGNLGNSSLNCKAIKSETSLLLPVCAVIQGNTNLYSKLEKQNVLFLILNFRRVLTVVCLLLGCSSASVV